MTNTKKIAVAVAIGAVVPLAAGLLWLLVRRVSTLLFRTLEIFQ